MFLAAKKFRFKNNGIGLQSVKCVDLCVVVQANNGMELHAVAHFI